MKFTKDKGADEGIVVVDEDGNPVELDEGEEYEFIEEDVAPESAPGGLSFSLNRAFHFLDRGGSLGAEIAAGVGMGLLAVCIAFLNMQVIGNLLTEDVVLANSPQSAENIAAALSYAQFYSGAVIVSILGTVAIGVAANLPLVQVSMMGLSSSMLCLVESGCGLAVENLLFLNIVAGVAYAVLVLVPSVRDAVASAIPSSVRVGLAASVGLVFAYAALRSSGLIAAGSVSLGGTKAVAIVTGVSVAGVGVPALAGVAVALAVFIVLSVLGKGKPQLFSLLAGTVAFLGISAAVNGVDTANVDSIANFGRVWLVAGSQASATTPFADSYLTYFASSIPAVFAGIADVVSKGMDFSGYSGNVAALVVSGTLCYLFCGLLGTEGVVGAVAAETGLDAVSAGTACRRAKFAIAGSMVVGALLGVGSVCVAPLSFGAAKDRAKSGLASIFAAVVMLVSLFILIVPALFATSTYPVTSMMQWNYFAYGNGGFVYLVRDVAMAVADLVMVAVGFSMAGSLLRLRGVGELVPAILMAVVSLITLNIVAGAAVGMLVAILQAALARDKASSVLSAPALVLEALLIVATVLM